jgi:hypothetical protein
MFDLVERANLAVDNGIRLSTFVALRKRGSTPAQAASVAKNLTVQFARLAPVLSEARLIAAVSAFDWTLFGSSSLAQVDQARVRSSAFDSPADQRREGLLTLGLRRRMESGGGLTLQQSVQRIDNNSPRVNSDPNPSNAVNITAQIDQPLLRNFGSEATLAEVRLAANADRDAVQQLKATLVQQVGDTESAYWELVRAHGELKIARRLLERGVRFIQLWTGAGQPWDNHDEILEHRKLGQQTDGAIAAFMSDLKQRGLWDETLMMWGGEFGRTPAVELPTPGANAGKQHGRDHNHYGFTMWLAGGGVRGGYTHGATDEFGFQATENPVHVHDLHATILKILGFDHEKFTYRYAGLDFRLTGVNECKVVRELLA